MLVLIVEESSLEVSEAETLANDGFAIETLLNETLLSGSFPNEGSANESLATEGSATETLPGDGFLNEGFANDKVLWYNNGLGFGASFREASAFNPSSLEVSAHEGSFWNDSVSVVGLKISFWGAFVASAFGHFPDTVPWRGLFEGNDLEIILELRVLS